MSVNERSESVSGEQGRLRERVLTPSVLVVSFGLASVLLGATVLEGVWAGMAGLWGLTLVALAVAGVLVRRFLKVL